MTTPNTAAITPQGLPATLPPELAALLAPHCSRQTGPGAGAFFAVSRAGLLATARALGTGEAGAMTACLRHGVWPLRFARNRGVFSAGEQAALLEARVLVLGCGGLGGHVAELLARAGVGAFTLCDPDVFEESNLNRQRFCTLAALGQNKALAVRDAVLALAPHAGVTAWPLAAGPDTLPGLLRGAHLVVDCLDSLPTRFEAEAAAHAAGVAFLHAALAGEEGFVLLSRPGASGLAGLYGGAAGSGPNAEAALGVPTVTPAAVAALQARLALQELARPGAAACGLWHADLSAPLLEVFDQ